MRHLLPALHARTTAKANKAKQRGGGGTLTHGKPAKGRGASELDFALGFVLGLGWSNRKGGGGTGAGAGLSGRSFSSFSETEAAHLDNALREDIIQELAPEAIIHLSRAGHDTGGDQGVHLVLSRLLEAEVCGHTSALARALHARIVRTL